MMKYSILILLWIFYGLIHSIFASHWMKAFFNRHFAQISKYYRLIYVTFATLGILGIIWYMSTLSQRFVFQQTVGSVFAGLFIATLGSIFMLIAFRSYDLKEFIGLRQLSEDFQPESFTRSGLLNYVRHPMYTGSILAIIGICLFAPALSVLITSICLLAYFVIGIHFEELKLISAFGKDYENYKKEVPSLVPSKSFFHDLFVIIKKC